MARKYENVQLPDVLDLIYIDGSDFMLDADYNCYWEEKGKEYRVRVPKGYVTDLSSIPRWARSVIPVVGRQNGPSVIHDYIYEPLSPQVGGGHQLRGWTKQDADNLFLAAMKAAGVNWYRRNAMYLAVKFGGGRAWRTKNK
jgi:hypothetical protein